MAKEMYTIGEVARLLRFSDDTIREWVRTGRIKATRPGLRAYRIPRAEVERLLAQHQIDPRALDDDDLAGDDTMRGQQMTTREALPA